MQRLVVFSSDFWTFRPSSVDYVDTYDEDGGYDDVDADFDYHDGDSLIPDGFSQRSVDSDDSDDDGAYFDVDDTSDVEVKRGLHGLSNATSVDTPRVQSSAVAPVMEVSEARLSFYNSDEFLDLQRKAEEFSTKQFDVDKAVMGWLYMDMVGDVARGDDVADGIYVMYHVII